MESVISKLENLKRKTTGYWPERIISQLEYAIKLSKVRVNKYDRLISDVINLLDESFASEAALTKATAQKAENMMLVMSQDAKSFKMICTAHAHIDMNWLWGYAETVAVTLDTFRTMLNMMKEYPEFRFSQSQASVYSIVEEYDPVMLEEIKARVKEGRWEVTASTWVETDKNMPNGESLSRHILYTKKYLSSLLELDPDNLTLDFEPDTFGHNLNVPEILTNGGVKFYYHCRGYDGHNIYKWQSPSGSSIIVYREPVWYNAEIKPNMAFYVPEFCSEHGIDTMLKVYGVGDHGGGPTRKDIEKIIEMSRWPVFPEIRFGTFMEYFNLLEKLADNLPVVDQELNFIFEGCYTTQTRIKMSNRISEAKLNEAEAMSALSKAFAGGEYPSAAYEDAWKKVLFNHFHDILPGSGIIDTREYALGRFQQVLATANTGISKALRGIASQIDTSSIILLEEDVKDTVSEGAGVGYAIKDFGVPQTERGKGKNRIFHFFNTSAHDRCEPVEITVWDWPGNKEQLFVKDADGRIVKHQLIEGKTDTYMFPGNYWGHDYIKLLLDVDIPSYGYTTYVLGESELQDIVLEGLGTDPRVDREEFYVMENDLIKVVFDNANAAIKSLVDKKTGKEILDGKSPASVFRLIEEDDVKGMTAWCVGRYINVSALNQDVKIGKMHLDTNAIRQWISYEIEFRASKLNVMVSLDHNSALLDFSVKCEWLEIAKKGKYVPQLSFYLPVAYKCNMYKYDIPFGVVSREGQNLDVPANSWGLAMPEQGEESGIMVITNTKYGFRGIDNSLSVTLIRSSYDPDPHPELGIHEFRLGVCVAPDVDNNAALIDTAYDFCHPVHFVSGTRHKGILPLSKSFISLEKGSAALSAVKMPEAVSGGCKLLLRAYETAGEKSEVSVSFAEKVTKAYFTDINENSLNLELPLNVEGNRVTFEMKPWSLANVCVEFA